MAAYVWDVCDIICPRCVIEDADARGHGLEELHTGQRTIRRKPLTRETT